MPTTKPFLKTATAILVVACGLLGSARGDDALVQVSTAASPRVAYSVERLAGVAWREAAQFTIDREARPNQHRVVLKLRVKAVERAYRRATGNLADDVVDASVTWADEALSSGREANRAAEVHAERRDRDVVVVLIARLGIELRVVLADVDR